MPPGCARGELLHNCFAYHFTPAGMMLEGGARALGCPVFPAGTGNTEMQARAAAHLRPACYAGTPDFLKAILEKGDELGLDLSSLPARPCHRAAPICRRCAPSTPTAALTVLQSYGTADLGLIAYESDAREGLILRRGRHRRDRPPRHRRPVPDGEVGEVLVTTARHAPIR